MQAAHVENQRDSARQGLDDSLEGCLTEPGHVPANRSGPGPRPVDGPGRDVEPGHLPPVFGEEGRMTAGPAADVEGRAAWERGRALDQPEQLSGNRDLVPRRQAQSVHEPVLTLHGSHAFTGTRGDASRRGCHQVRAATNTTGRIRALATLARGRSPASRKPTVATQSMTWIPIIVLIHDW